MGIPRHPRPRFNSIVAQVRPRVSASVGACFVVAFTFIGVRLVSLIENRIDGLAEDQRRARYLFIACLMLSLSGCATLRSTNNELDSYVGRSVSEVAGNRTTDNQIRSWRRSPVVRLGKLRRLQLFGHCQYEDAGFALVGRLEGRKLATDRSLP